MPRATDAPESTCTEMLPETALALINEVLVLSRSKVVIALSIALSAINAEVDETILLPEPVPAPATETPKP